MRRIFWSGRGRSSTPQWAACLGFGCASDDSPEVRRYLTGYCAVGQIHRAASVGAVATVERFLTFRVNGVNDTDKRNRTALHYACAHGHLGVVTLLIERNCDINARDDDSCTPLIKASQRQHEECAALLLRHGADPNAVDALGNTALHYAVHSENMFIASQLLEHSANIEAKTKDGFTPLSLALRQNKDLIAELLVEKGANIHRAFHPGSGAIPKKQQISIHENSVQTTTDDSTEHNSLPRASCKSGHDSPRQTTEDDSNVDTKDEVASKTSPPRQKASQARKTNLLPDHLQKTSQEQKRKKKGDTGHAPEHAACPSMKTHEKAQQSEQLNKVLKYKLRPFPEPFKKEPSPGTSKEKVPLKAEEERKFRLQEPDVALENSNDRTACTVASACAAAAAASERPPKGDPHSSLGMARTQRYTNDRLAVNTRASASDASAAAAAASGSASEASAAAAAASSNTAVKAVVTAAVTAAFAAVAAAEHKGNAPTLQRPSGAASNKDFGLKEKEEHDKSEPVTHLIEINNSENKKYFPRESETISTFEKCTTNPSALPQVKDSCIWEVHQDERRPARSTSKEEHEVRKQINVLEGLHDRTVSSQTASDDYTDSGCLLGLWDELYLYKRLLEIKDSCAGVLIREIKKMEAEHGGAHKELSKITKVLSQLEQRETEQEERCHLRYDRYFFKRSEKRISDACCYGKMKTELRDGERQYHEEFERQLLSPSYHQCYNEEFDISQHQLFLENLNINLKALNNSVTQLQEAQLGEDPQREGVLSSPRTEHLLRKLEVECLKLEHSVKYQAEEIEEIETQLLREDLTGDRKKQGNKLTESAQFLAGALEQEKEKTEELEKELHRFMEVLKITEEKLNECENRELCFHGHMKNRTFEALQHEIHYLKDTWEPIHCKYLHQDINIQLAEQELLKIKTDQEDYESLCKIQGNVEKEVLALKHLVQESMTQAEDEKTLEELRENKNGSRMSQVMLRVKSLESKLPEIKSQVDSSRREMEKYKQRYIEENKSRKSLSSALKKMMERLEVSKKKLVRVNQQKMTLETILSSLPVQQCPQTAKLNPAVGRSPSLPPNDSSFLPTSEPQPVGKSMRKGLSKRQIGLVKRMTREAEEDSAPVDPWSFEASAL